MEQRIGFGKRLGALVIDIVIIGVVSVLGGGVIGAVLGAGAGAVAGAGDQNSQAAAALFGGIIGTILGIVIASTVVCVVYYLIEGLSGYTLGKLALGIRIASADGTAAPMGQLMGRYAVKNIGSLLFVAAAITGVESLKTVGSIGGLVIFIGCFMVLGASKQALHDRIVGTAVFPKGAIRAAA